MKNLPVALKSVLPVALLGVLSVLIILHSMLSLRSLDQDYRALVERDARASLLINAALLDLADASRLALAVLSLQEEARMRASHGQLDRLQQRLQQRLGELRPLLPDQADTLAQVEQQQRLLFVQAATIVDAAARWRGDRALRIIDEQFDPTLQALRASLDVLHGEINQHFSETADQLQANARQTRLSTTLTAGLALLILLGLASWLALIQLSRPIRQLTQAMHQLSQRDYSAPIQHGDRHDEIGRMAQALQVFRDSMQRADHLEREAAAVAEAKRLGEQLRDVTNAMPGAAFQLLVQADGSQQFIFLSGKAERFIGRREPGPSASGLLLDEIRVSPANDLAGLVRLSLKQLTPLDFDMQVQPGNAPFWLKTLASVRLLDNGDRLLNGIWLDISEIKAQAQALDDARHAAEQAAEVKANFLATMSHEIRTPLNAIIGLTRLSLREPLPDSLQQRLDKVLHAGQHLLGILNDILDFSKAEGGHLQAEQIPFRPQQLLDDCQTLLGERAEEHGLQLHCEPVQIPGLLLGDPLRISQILTNYVSNAIKFSDRGQVQLRLALEHGPQGELYLRGEVQDQGIGLTEEQIGTLFQPFQQADSSITRRFGGTGLGLAICHNLAKLLGGSVGVQSAPWHGSTFWFRVRVREAEGGSLASNPSAALDSEQLQRLRGLRVLLVDDNELNRLVASELLSAAGIVCEQAENGRLALERLHEEQGLPFDALLMDMMMPELDGLSTTRLLRANPRFTRLPVIAMTANASREDIERCLAAGMNAHVAKPIDEQLLWRALLSNGQDSLDPAPAPQPATDAQPVLDPRPLRQLQALVDPQRFAHMQGLFISTLQRQQHWLADPANHAMPALRQCLHDLTASAGHAGLCRLTTLLQQLQSQLQRQQPLSPAQLDSLQQQLTQARAALEALA